MNVKKTLKEIDKEQCENTFDNFKSLHDIEINHIVTSSNKLISSMGI